VVDYANASCVRCWARASRRADSCPAFYAKFALAGAHKLVARARRAGLPLTVDFRVDPASADGFAGRRAYRS